MRVLSVLSAYRPNSDYGGPITVAEQHARELTNRGHSVSILATNIIALRPYKSMNPAGCVTENGISIERVASIALGRKYAIVFPREIRRIARLVARSDVVHVHYAREPLPALAAEFAIYYGVPLFLQPHGMLNSTSPVRGLIDRTLAKRALRQAAGVFALQEIERSKLVRIEASAPIKLLPNGITLAPTEARWTLDSLEHGPITFLGRLHKLKGVVEFVDMAAALLARGLKRQFCVIGPDAGDLRRARLRAESLGITDRVEFAGAFSHDEAMEALRTAAVYVVPSRSDQFPMAVMEALSRGVPTVVSDGVQFCQALSDSGSAIVTTQSPNALAEAVRHIIERPHLASALSQRALAAASGVFSIQSVVDSLEASYMTNRLPMRRAT